MLGNWKVRFAGVAALGLAAFTAPAWSANPAHPGTLNYVEGQVNLNGQPLSQQAVGVTELENGQVLETQHGGKAEVLLTPGVFLRVGDSSAVRMDADGLTHTEVALLRGNAMVEVTQLYKGSNVQVADNGAVVTLEKKGIYDFDANQPKVAVYDGEAQVKEGDSQVTVKKGKEVALAAPVLKTTKFDRDVHDDLYNWSYVRSEYLADASAASARTYIVNSPGWFGAGWYWNPWFSAYSFIPGDGFLYSPFGWGFYSPAYVGYAPLFVGVRGYAGGRVIPHGVAAAPRATAAPMARGSLSTSGFARGGFGGGFSGGMAHGFAGGHR
jgi:hypothetical protein